MDKKSSHYYISDNFYNLWIFKYTSNNEIIYELYNNQNEKIYTGKLAAECTEDFIVNIGEQNGIHIVARKISGDLVYYFFNGKKWSVQSLYNLNKYKNSFKLLALHFWENKTHILYAIQGKTNPENWIWIDQYWEDNTWKHNKVFQAEIKDHTLQYASTQDNSGNIYFISQWWDRTEHQMEFFQFHSKLNLWNKNSLTFKKGDKYAPNIWCTEKNHKIHTCWVLKNNEKYTLNYRNKDIAFTEGSQWSKEQEIYSTINKPSNLFFAEINKILTLYWIENNILYYLQSINLGESWEKSHLSLAKLSDPYVFNFIFKKTINNNKSNYIVFDYKNSKTYPISFTNTIVNAPNTTQANSKNAFYPSPQSQINTNKNKSFNLADPSLNLTKPSMSFNEMKTLDDSDIQNLSEEQAKIYLKIYKDYFIKLHTEYKLSKNFKNSIDKKQNSLYVPASYENQNKNKTGKQIIKERLKTRIIENENIELKSEITDYRNIIDEMQKDIKTLKKEINNMDHNNKVLQKEIYEIKENSLVKKFSNFFNGS